MNFGVTKKEGVNTNPEGEDTIIIEEGGARLTLDNTPNIELSTGGAEDLSSNRDLQVMASDALVDFFNAIERLNKCTVKLNELSIEAESRMRLNG